MATQFLEKKASTALIVDLPGAAGAGVVSGEVYVHNGTVPAKLAKALRGIQTITGDGAITITDGSVVMTKGSAAAVTLAAPTAAQLGTEMDIYAGSAFAHVVTATGLVDDGVTGGSKTTLTFGAFVGASITLKSVQSGKWAVKAKNVVTIT